jgi:hypothetical protein
MKSSMFFEGPNLALCLLLVRLKTEMVRSSETSVNFC